MPSGHVHVLAGLPIGVAVLALAAQQGQSPEPLIVVGGVIGALWADWDATGSTITTLTGRRTPVSWISLGVSRLIQATLGHRGAFHSLLVGGLFSLAAWYFLGPWVAVAFGGGYLSHLLLDKLLTRSRVPWFWPLRSGRGRRRPSNRYKVIRRKWQGAASRSRAPGGRRLF